MIIIKFAMVFFLVFLTAVMVQRQNPGPLQGGPYYFLDMPGNRNPVQDKYRLNAYQALHRRNVWRIWFDARSHPVDMRLYKDGRLVLRQRLIYDKNGAIRYRGPVQ